MILRTAPVSLFTAALFAGCAVVGLSNAANASLVAANISVTENAVALPDAANLSPLALPLTDLGTSATRIGGVSFNFQVMAVQGGIVQGDLVNQYAAPIVDAKGNTYEGAYFSTGLGSITLSFDQSQSEIGLLWGSVDPGNSITLYNGTTFVGELTGAQVVADASTAITHDNSEYVTIATDTPFDTVVLASSEISFESVVYTQNATLPPLSIVSADVPEPASLSIFGVGTLALTAMKRRRRLTRQAG